MRLQKRDDVSRDLLGFRSVSLRLSVHEDGPRADLFQNRSNERGSPRDRNGVSLNAQSLCSMRCFSPNRTISRTLERMVLRQALNLSGLQKKRCGVSKNQAQKT